MSTKPVTSNQSVNSREPEVLEVAEDCFAFYQPPGGWCVNNAGFIRSDDSVLVIDTVATANRAVKLRAAVSDRTSRGLDTPATIVTTHHHGDHHFGHSYFTNRTEVIAHSRAREEIIAAGLGMTKLFSGVDWGEIELTLPTITFDDRLVVYVGDVKVELIHLGVAHTTNDIVAWVPSQRLLYSGDLVMSGGTPYCLMGSVRGSISVLHKLKALNPAVVVPGHGPVGGVELIDDNLRYLTWLTEVAEYGYAHEIGSLTLAKSDRARYDLVRADSERTVSNIDRAYVELAGGEDGTPIDIGASFMRMVELNGGPPSCFA